jgi:hypothetical protein
VIARLGTTLGTAAGGGLDRLLLTPGQRPSQPRDLPFALLFNGKAPFALYFVPGNHGNLHLFGNVKQNTLNMTGPPLSPPRWEGSLKNQGPRRM